MKNKLTLITGAVLALSLSFTHSVYAKDNYKNDTKHSHQQKKHVQHIKVVKVVQKNDIHNKNVHHKQYVVKKAEPKSSTSMIKIKANNSPSITILVAETSSRR